MMKATIERRELFALENLKVLIQGTYHHPPQRTATVSKESCGVLFLNGMYVTRAANGDSAVYWADSLAEAGYPAFRVDLPGFGDSGGDPPADWLGYINSGGYAPIAAEIVSKLTSRFHLSGLVLVGHCAGAVSALYTAASSAACRGLILMDPYFYLPQIAKPGVRKQLNLWARQNFLGSCLSKGLDALKYLRLMLRANALPENTNFPLLRCWRQVAAAELPILILRAPTRGASASKPRVGEFDYFKHIMKTAGPQVAMRLIEGGNHSFSNRAARAAVRHLSQQWLSANFPLVDAASTRGHVPRSGFSAAHAPTGLRESRTHG